VISVALRLDLERAVFAGEVVGQAGCQFVEDVTGAVSGDHDVVDNDGRRRQRRRMGARM
jgi:hypothetical protein